jgi:hypothetical protein
MSWINELKNDPTYWLLEDSNPSVRFWALKDILDLDPRQEEVLETQKSIMSSAEVTTILENQNPEGFWVHRDNMYLPKYTATTHQLLILAELGAKRTHSVDKALEHIFEFQRSSGHFLPELPKTLKGINSRVYDGCCFDGNILFYMIHFGHLNDERVQRLIDFIINTRDAEKRSWKCRSYPINPDKVFPANCYMGACKVLKAFSIIPTNKRSSYLNEIIESEVENILENEVYRYLKDKNGSRKNKAGWMRFGFPLFYQADVLEVLDTLTRIGIRDERMGAAINLVLDSQGDDGKWLLKNTFNGKMWVDIEEKNKPSKWITLRACRVLKRYFC